MSSTLNNGKKQRKEERSLKDAIYLTASAMKKAFPHGTKVLSIGDLTIGLAFVSMQHQKTNLLQEINQNPKLHPKFQSKQTEGSKQSEGSDINPEAVSLELLNKCANDLFFADLVYEPDIYLKMKCPNVHEFISTNEDLSLFDNYFEMYTEQKNTNTPIFHHVFSVDESKHLQTAHLVGLDLPRKQIIIAIRGTYSLQDIFTDFTANPKLWKVREKFHLQNADELEYIEGYVHEGMYKSAQWILNQIRPILVDMIINFPSFSSKIQICGHSLGASIATVLGICLREEFASGTIQQEVLSKWKQMNESQDKHGQQSNGFDQELTKKLLPKIHVSSFAPSTVLSQQLSEWCSSFVTSFVIGGDLIPRFGSGQGEELRMEILDIKWEEKFDKMKQDLYGKVLEYNEYFKSVSSFADQYGLPIPKIVKQIGDKEDYHSIVASWFSSSDDQIADDLEENQKKLDILKKEKEKQEEQQKKQIEIDRAEKNNDVICLYPPGEIYLFVDDEAESSTATLDEEKKENSTLQKITSLIGKAADHMYEKYGDVGIENKNKEGKDDDETSTNESSSVTGSNLPTSPETQRASSKTVLESTATETKKATTMAEEATITTTVSEVTTPTGESTNQDGPTDNEKNDKDSSDHDETLVRRKFIIRNVCAKHFDRIIIHKNMLEDHKLIYYRDAFKSLIRKENE